MAYIFCITCFTNNSLAPYPIETPHTCILDVGPRTDIGTRLIVTWIDFGFELGDPSTALSLGSDKRCLFESYCSLVKCREQITEDCVGFQVTPRLATFTQRSRRFSSFRGNLIVILDQTNYHSFDNSIFDLLHYALMVIQSYLSNLTSLEEVFLHWWTAHCLGMAQNDGQQTQ